jgi:hypothetical protein
MGYFQQCLQQGSGAQALTPQSRKISSLNASPCLGRSGAVIMPFIIGVGLVTDRSVRRRLVCLGGGIAVTQPS